MDSAAAINASAKKARNAQTLYCPHQPTDVAVGRAADRMQCVPDAAFEMAANHTIVVFGVADSRLDRLAAL